MKYTQPKFTLPAGSPKITQEQWDLAFGKPKTRKKKIKKEKAKNEVFPGLETVGYDAKAAEEAGLL